LFADPKGERASQVSQGVHQSSTFIPLVGLRNAKGSLYINALVSAFSDHIQAYLLPLLYHLSLRLSIVEAMTRMLLKI
jgi:hypothetical protein